MRKSGVLMPIFSLPSPYGIGCFSKEAEEFADALKRGGQTLWQILPLTPTSYGDSPYQSPSLFAGNPYFIDINRLREDGLLTRAECEEYERKCTGGGIDYGFLYETRPHILKKAFSRFSPDSSYDEFAEKSSGWLNSWALFASIKEYFGKSFYDWPEELLLNEDFAVFSIEKKLKKEIEYQKFLQYEFFTQWARIKAYANERGIEIIGDMPIYTARDSADLWSNPRLFDLNSRRRPNRVAGCPPDGFSPKGQLWGNPVYDWAVHKKDGFKWWVERMKHAEMQADIVRIDHFRGLESFYSVPDGSADATDGSWQKSGGEALFRAVKRSCPNLKVIAEDLGFTTPQVRRLLDKTGFSGMKVLQFAFDSDGANEHLNHNHKRNSVVYTGTHDNPTALEWANTASKGTLRRAAEYMGVKPQARAVAQGLIRLAEASVAEMCIIPVQDWLGLGGEARLNTPSVPVGNWRWRLKKDEFNEKIQEEMYKITALYGRLPEKG